MRSYRQILALNRLLFCHRCNITFNYSTKVPPESRFAEAAIKFVGKRKSDNSSDDLDAPIKYMQSPASTYSAKISRMGVRDSRLWYEPYVIIGSVAVFLIYFTVLREENDIDKELSVSLYDRVEGLEEMQLRASLAYNKTHGKDTTDIIKRLKEIEMEKQRSAIS